MFLKIQLVRVLNPTGNSTPGNLVATSGTSKVMIGSTTATSIKVE